MLCEHINSFDAEETSSGKRKLSILNPVSVDLVDHVYSFLSKDPTNVGGLTLDTVRIICSSDCISGPKQEYIDQLYDYHECST